MVPQYSDWTPAHVQEQYVSLRDRFAKWNEVYQAKISPDFDFHINDGSFGYLLRHYKLPFGVLERLIYYVAQLPKSENSFYAVYDFMEIVRGYYEEHIGKD